MAPVLKKKDQSDVENYRPVSILPIFPKVSIFTKGVCTIKCMNTLTKFSQQNNIDFAKVLVHNIVFLQWLKKGENVSIKMQQVERY